jgi:hypothetical protein
MPLFEKFDESSAFVQRRQSSIERDGLCSDLGFVILPSFSGSSRHERGATGPTGITESIPALVPRGSSFHHIDDPCARRATSMDGRHLSKKSGICRVVFARPK